MISAEKAKEILQAAQTERDAYVKACIEREVEDVCEVIARAARDIRNSCRIEASRMDYPKGVTAYLKYELGYVATYENHTISVK